MNEQPETQFPPPEAYRAAAAGQQVPYTEAAAKAVGQAVDPEAAGEDADAGPVLEQIRQQVTREVLLPMETKIQAMMDAAAAQQDTLRAQIEQLQAQLTATRAQVGPPAATLYAKSVAQRVRSIAAMHADQGAAHFASVIEAADKLGDAAAEVAKGAAGPDVLDQLAAPVEKWFSSRRGRHLEGSGTVLAELGHLAEETDKLKAA
jgi:hypothetical protein